MTTDSFLTRFDRAGDAALDRVRGNRKVDRLMYTASEVGNHSIIWHLVGTGMALRREQPASAAVRTVALMGLESAIVNGPIKSVFRRQRPPPPAGRPHLLRQPRTSSFPSGHASAATTFVAITASDDPLRPILALGAAVVAISRAHVQIHHVSDVAGGVVTGIILGRLFRRWWPPGADRPVWPRSDTQGVVCR